MTSLAIDTGVPGDLRIDDDLVLVHVFETACGYCESGEQVRCAVLSDGSGKDTPAVVNDVVIHHDIAGRLCGGDRYWSLADANAAGA